MKTSEKTNWIGIDVNLETSLCEYGMVMDESPNKDGSGSHTFIYKGDNGNYYISHIYPNDIESLIAGEDWMDEEDVKSFLSCMGQTKKEWKSMDLILKVYDLVSYYGNANIFGSEYWEGMTIDRVNELHKVF